MTIRTGMNTGGSMQK
ncbi:hypothetical protein TPHV1_190045 [Treponema phagedenis]|uniref:Uncharacterized protein n=1 Tax=Treponema phagedenis TaxID=162 RepID=A0A0B7GSI6_TREPH|nr:hypothetical protein TPHV1_190045 [Treponema phagedenis]